MKIPVAGKKICTISLTVLLLISIFGTVFTAYSAAQAPPREKTLYVDIDTGTIADPTNFNYMIPGGSMDQGGHQLILDALFYVNLETGEVIPWLAEGYEYNANYTKFIIHLRRGVKWNDGENLTADDVVFTYNIFFEYAPQLTYSTDVVDRIKSVRKVDDYTVELTLNYANPRFHYDDAASTLRCWGTLHVVPKHIWEGEDPLTFRFYPPVGTGPYKLISASQTSFLYERNDDWWATEVFGIRPAPEYVNYVSYGPEETSAMRMAVHELDAICGISAGTYLAIRDKNPYVKAWHTNEPYLWLDPCPKYLSLSWMKYPFNIPEVRRAIAYLVDNDEVVRVSLEGASYPSWGPFPFYGGLQPYFDAIEDLIEECDWQTTCNSSKAEEIFNGLGFTKGTDDIWVTPNGTRLELSILACNAFPEMEKIGIVIADQLRDGGIDAVVQNVDMGPYFGGILPGEYDSAIKPSCPGDTDPFFTLVQWTSPYYAPIGQSSQGLVKNTERYKNPEYDAILEELAETSPTDVERCTELFTEAMTIWFNDLPMGIAINQGMRIVPFDTYYWTGWPSADNPWFQPACWWDGFSLVLTGYPSPDTGEIVGGVKPATLDYTTIYFTKDTPKFRGIDLTWYGPFETADTARIPADDAEFWIRKEYASYTPVTPAELGAIAQAVSNISAIVDALKTGVDAINSDVKGISGTIMYLATGIVIEAIVIIVFAVALMRRRPTKEK